MTKPPINLPIEDALPDLLRVMARDGVCVLQAPPGAGKTTRVPLALLEAGAFQGRLIMLEPRRLAARAAAERMADMLGEQAGQTVGYRMRGDTKISKITQIEVVTEGVLTRMIQNDPSLDGIGMVIFDEFHERSLNGDLGLALVCETRAALRDDLQLLVMSATLDAAPVAQMLGAQIVTSDGRAYPIDTHWLDRPHRRADKPWQRAQAFIANTCALIEQAAAQHDGSILTFLPGAREIRDVAAKLNINADIRPLYGALPFADQRAAIAPSKHRKVVLATSIAETSLTIEDIRIVVDTGRARRARFDPGSGMSRLVTEPVSKAEADQRRGRAGRVSQGVCYRMWTRAEEGALPAFPPAEIEATDLSGLALELAAWGAQPSDLNFLTAPPDGAYSEAQALLQMIGSLDANNRITAHGKRLTSFPMHPRLAHMMVRAGASAADLAAILSARDPVETRESDLILRIRAIKQGQAKQISTEAKRIARLTDHDAGLSLGEQAALAYPDRIGLRRKGDDPRYILSGGKGAALANDDALAGARLIVAANLDGDAREARIRQAVQISEGKLRGLYADQITWHRVCEWSKRDRRVIARKREMFGALTLADQVWTDIDPDAQTKALMDGIRDLGLQALNWTKPATLLRARVMATGLRDWSDDALLADLDWLSPFAANKTTAQDIKAIDLHAALKAGLDWDATQALDTQAPAHFTTPLGHKTPIDYSQTPAITLRLQEMFGVMQHPIVAGQPLKITLLSPGHKPVQVTTDLPGFWASSYADVRKDMRGRYPKHPWPEDPTQADPTLRAKPRR